MKEKLYLPHQCVFGHLKLAKDMAKEGYNNLLSPWDHLKGVAEGYSES